jgi:hypothetical protein
MKRKRPKISARKRATTKPARPRPRPARQTVRSTNETDPVDALVTAGAQALGIPLDPAWQASVAFNLRLILSHAAKVETFPLTDEAEPAPVLHA